jgi:signal transduction histidine kinase
MRRRTPNLLPAISIALLMPVWVSQASTHGQPSRTVLTIHWGPEDFPGTHVLDAAIQEAVSSPADPPVHYYAEYLETEEFPSEAASLAFRDYIRRKFAGRHTDVVIADSTPALQFALRHRAGLFPGVPIVFVAGSMRALTIGRPAKITGVLSDAAFSETLDLALGLHPSVRRVFVVAQAPTSDTYDERVRTALSQFSDRVELTYIKEKSVQDLLAAVKAVPAQSLIFYARYTPEHAERVVHPDEVVRMLTSVSPVPIYCANDLYLGTGVVGGMMKGSRAIGTRLGELARQILDGTRPEDIPLSEARVVPTFDWRQVKRWGIDPSRLPPGSNIQFRIPTVWERYKRYILGAAGLVLAQTALIATLLVQSARRRRAEVRVRASQTALRASLHRLRDLGGRLIGAQEAERSRVARELHDDVGQQTALLEIDLELLREDASRRTADLRTGLENALNRTRTIAQTVRDLSHRLHPPALRLIGPAAALASLQREFGKSNVVVTLYHQNIPGELPQEVTLCMFRITQEALRNAVTHGAARAVSITLTGDETGLTLVIADDGVGFNVNSPSEHGLGLTSMRERLEPLGGMLKIRSTPGAGTRLEITVPYRPDAEQG